MEKEDIEKAKMLSSIKLYMENNLNLDDVIYSQDNQRSGKFGDIDINSETFAQYNKYKNYNLELKP